MRRWNRSPKNAIHQGGTDYVAGAFDNDAIDGQFLERLDAKRLALKDMAKRNTFVTVVRAETMRSFWSLARQGLHRIGGLRTGFQFEDLPSPPGDA